MKLLHVAFRLSTALVLTIIAGNSLSYSATNIVPRAQDTTNVLLYGEVDAAGGRTISWVAVPSKETLGQVHLPFPTGTFAAPANGHHVAVVSTRAQGSEVYIINLNDPVPHKLSVPVLHKEVYYRDVRHIQSLSLRWSPDGRTLAYVGQTAPGRADVFLYDTITAQQTNLSAHIPFVDDFVNLSDWSPDGNWLAFTGRWGQPGLQVSMAGGGLLSHDGNELIALAPTHDLCDLVWSPNQHYLFSHNDCLSFNNVQDSRDLTIYPLNLEQTDVPQPSSFRLSEITTNPWWRFHHPMWHEDGNIIMLRTFDQPLLNGTPVGTPGPDAEIIRVDVVTRHLQVMDYPLTMTVNTIQRGYQVNDWLFQLDNRVLHGYQPSQNRSFAVTLTNELPCSAFHARLSVDERYLALCVGIYPDEPLPALLIWDVTTNQEVLRVPATGDNPPVPLGWMSLEDRP